MKMFNASSWKPRCTRLLFSLLACLSAAQLSAAEPISESALTQIRGLQNEKASRTAVQHKLDSQLVYALRQSRNQMAAFGVAHLQANVNRQPDGRVLLDINATVSPALLS